MSNENTTEQTTISHYEAKRAELLEDIAKAQAKVDGLNEKLAKLDAVEANSAAIEALKAGDAVSYLFGRALNKRVLSGVIVATGKNDKGVLQLKVQTGEGLDAELNLIDSSALLMSAEEVLKAQEEIDAAVAEAQRLAAEAAAAKAAAGEGGQS
ncbi:hypothetical protein [Xanthomonas phage NED111]|uniref:Uncharacterized protein n=2 Tax=Pradovirus TaxID=1985733 RepID=A0A5B9N6E2_9CAUD|nr:hypothetical protein CPT_Pagan_015 [Xanthomonas phage Pagan]UZV39742.1 hypothetical protein [Xanthomonas phage NED111]